MATASICLYPDDAPGIRAVVLRTKEDGAFISLSLGGLTVYLPGYGQASADAAHAIIAALTTAAAEVVPSAAPITMTSDVEAAVS